MSLRSARPVDDSLSELAEQMALDEPSAAAAAARDNGESANANTQQCHIPVASLHVNTVKLQTDSSS